MIRDKGEELVRRLRGNVVSGDEKPQEPEVQFRKLFGFLSKTQKAVASERQQRSLKEQDDGHTQRHQDGPAGHVEEIKSENRS